MGEFWNTGRMAFDDVAGMADAALELRRFVVSPFSTNCYAVVSCGKAMVVDPGAEGARIAEALSDVDVELVVATHGHADHVGGVAALVAATGARFAISAADADLARHARRAHAFGIEYDDDAPEPDELLVPGGTTGVGEARFRVVATPGHTPGGVKVVGRGTALPSWGTRCLREAPAAPTLPVATPPRSCPLWARSPASFRARRTSSPATAMTRRWAGSCGPTPTCRRRAARVRKEKARASACLSGPCHVLVPEARVELARVSPEVFETSVSAIPPLGPVTDKYTVSVTAGDGPVLSPRGEGARHRVRFA